MTNDRRLTRLAKAQAYGLGFDLVGIAETGPATTPEAFDDWLSRGCAGEMEYLRRTAQTRHDTRLPFPGARTALVVGLPYGGRAPAGPIARYARGDDYHGLMRERLRELHGLLESAAGRPVAARAYVDTGPLLERDLAMRAGLGWFGKNTNLIHPRLGSFFFIGALLSDLSLEPDSAFQAEHCGSCTRCLEACPTQALTDAHQLDARRCISYLTIELKGAIPAELRERIGGLIYGCDICQDVCPFNRKLARAPAEPAFSARPALAGKDSRGLARDLLAMSTSEYQQAFRGSPMKRPKLPGLKRNAAVALGNAGNETDVALLAGALDDSEPVVRAHVAWALGRLRGAPARLALLRRLDVEEDPEVSRELRMALSSWHAEHAEGQPVL